MVGRHLDQAIAELGGREPTHDSSKRFASFAAAGSIARLLVPLLKYISSMAVADRFTYLLTSYYNSDRIVRLVERIQAEVPDARIVIMRDRDSAPLESTSCEVFITSRPVEWGDYSFLEALLESMSLLKLADNEWLTVLSEDSYPLRSLRDYQGALSHSDADCWLEQSIFENPAADALLGRYLHYAIALPGSRRGPLRAVLRLILPKIGIPVDGGRSGTRLFVGAPRLRRPFGPSLKPRMGSNWYVLKGRAATRVLAARGTDLERYFRKTFIPSEGFVHTILLNDNTIHNRPVDNHYCRFEGAHPRMFTLADFEELLDSEGWFARKILDVPLLDRLDIAVGVSTTSFR